MNSQNSKPWVQHPGTMRSTASLHLPPPVLTFIPLLSDIYLHQSRLSSTCFLFLLQIAMSYPNIMVHRDSCLNSSVKLSITTANKELTALKPLIHSSCSNVSLSSCSAPSSCLSLPFLPSSCTTTLFFFFSVTFSYTFSRFK